MSALGDGGEEGGKGKEVAQPKGWRLEIMKALRKCLLFPVINHLSQIMI